MNWIIDYLPHIFTGSAVIISIISFYFLHVCGPIFRFEHLTKEERDLTYESTSTHEHMISIVNEGNKTGVIKKITSDSVPDAEIKRLKTRVYRGKNVYEIEENEPFAVIGIGPKESIVIKSEFSANKPTKEAPKYRVKIVVDKKIKIRKLSDKDKKELVVCRK